MSTLFVGSCCVYVMRPDSFHTASSPAPLLLCVLKASVFSFSGPDAAVDGWRLGQSAADRKVDFGLREA